jgi:beta-phosphoglucomutase-like phosphatase (HAD superfamily)
VEKALNIRAMLLDMDGLRPDIFLEAARGLNVAPAGCLVLEDSDAGIMAAAAAGMPALMIPDVKQPSAQSAATAMHICKTLEMPRDG